MKAKQSVEENILSPTARTLIKQAKQEERDNLKAQVRKEIEEQAPEDWMSYDEKNGYDIAITDCLSIPSLKGEE